MRKPVDCTPEQHSHLIDLGHKMVAAGIGVERTPCRAYVRQRQNARKRGIGWELSLWQWWTVWQESGHWDDRGRGQGYVMCRERDVGPYAIDNVFIALGRENNSRAHSKTSGLPMGVSRYGKLFFARRQIAGKKVGLGCFKTPELAHAAYLASFNTDQARAA